MSYRHTQRGVDWSVLFALGLGFAVIIGVSLVIRATEQTWVFLLPVGLTLVIFAAVLVIFSRLTVTVEGREVEVRFGLGAPRFRFRLEEFASARVVTSSRWLGFGIRIVPRGWLYNISGTDAVELTRPDRSVVRIGTDEPRALLAAIETAGLKGETR